VSAGAGSVRVGARARGELAIVLHTHMPYVEGFGTWPFGEEWLWEAMATSYLPLLDVLGRAPLTLSLTPVLADQLAAEGAGERFLAFLRDVRGETHRRDIEGCRAGGAPDLAVELERAATDYVRAAERFESLGRDLLGALVPHAAWTSSATHAILPLLATDAGARLQLDAGIESHRRRCGQWDGGLWLPECAYADWLDPLLTAAGVRATCLDLTDVHGPGAPEQLLPVALDGGVVAFPIDRVTIELAWGEGGYPTAPAYRDHHRHTTYHHRPWANHGGTYDHGAALAQARADARDFVARARRRVDDAGAALGRPALCVCALDTEFLGHWWYEGVAWLAGVIEEAARQDLPLTTLDDALARHEPVAPPDGGLPVSSWGRGRDLSTWSGPAVAGLATAARAAELRVVAAGERASERAVRELLALQASDWAFLVSWGTAGGYPRERAADHARALDEALAGLHSGEPRVRNLAPFLARAPLLVP